MVQKLTAEILAAWRHAERLAAELEPGLQRDVAVHASERLRALYHEMTSSDLPEYIGDESASEPELGTAT